MSERAGIKLFSPDWFMALFVAAIWAYQPLILNMSVYASKYVGIVFDVLVFIVLTFAFIKAKTIWQRKIRPIDIGFYFICVIVTFVSITFAPDSAEPIKDLIVPYILQVLTFYFVGLLIDIEKQKAYIYWGSILSILFQFFYFFFFLQRISGGVDLKGDLIVPATYTLPHVLVVLWYMFQKPNILNISLSVVSVVLLVSFANRGSILAAILFIVVYFFFLTPRKKSRVVKALMIIAAVGVTIFFDQIMDSLFGFTESYGMSTSIMDRMASGEIVDSNGRDFIYASALKYLSSEGLLGGGMGIDRVVLGTYAHNFVLELLMDFGIFFGGIIVVGIFILIIRSFIKTQSLEVKAFIAVLCGRGLIHMLLSGSYIEDGHFFLLIGFCVAALRQSKMRPQIQQANG